MFKYLKQIDKPVKQFVCSNSQTNFDYNMVPWCGVIMSNTPAKLHGPGQHARSRVNPPLQPLRDGEGCKK